MHGRPLRPLSLAAALAASTTLALAAPARAQGSDLPPVHVVSINPLGLLFSVFSIEYEGVISGTSTLGGSLSYLNADDDDFDDFRHTSLDAKYRLYPLERAPAGPAIGLTVGLTRVRDADSRCAPEGEECDEERSGTAFTTGLELDWNWLLGSRQDFAVGAGVGAKRLHFLTDRPRGVDRVVPTFRLMVGKTF
jgi:hypothetical protein